jgi:hypothetical protein
MVATALRPKNQSVRIDGRDLVIKGPVQFEVTNIHGQKSQQGDPGPDSHPTNSTLTQRSWEGGGQLSDANPASDMHRFDWSTLMTEYAKFLTLAPLTYVITPPTANILTMCWGDYPNGDNAEFFYQSGTNVYVYDPGVPAQSVAAGTTTVGAVNAGVCYRPLSGVDAGNEYMFIPGGSSGWARFDGTGATTDAADSFIDFAVWNDTLYGIDTAGVIKKSVDGIVFSDVVALTDGTTPRHLLNFVNRQDEETLYVVTNNDVWGFDADNLRLVKSYFGYPRHPRQGWGACQWRGEMWTSVGMGAFRYDLSQVIPSGLDRDQGLPAQYRGYVTDLVPAYNNLFFYVKGTDVLSTPVVETETLDLGGGDDPLYGTPPAATNNVLMAWNGIGFHYRWAGQGLDPGNAYVSSGHDEYNVFWSNDDKIYRQKLPIDYFNPGDQESASYEFEPYGEFYTPWYDWGWADQVKTLKKVEFKIRNATETETIEAFYKIDLDSNSWVSLGLMNNKGRKSFFLGKDPDDEFMPDRVTPKYAGIAHQRFKLKFIFRRGTDPTKRPTLDWWSAVGRKVLNPIRTWRFNVDLTAKNGNDTPQQMNQFLLGLVKTPTAVQFDIDDESFMVELVAMSGPTNVFGPNYSSFRTIHLLEANDIEIPLEGDA